MESNLFVQIIVCLFAGVGAGLGTGFAGLSAVVVIAPMLVTFLEIDHYTAVAVGLLSDVLASGVSALVYAKNKNIDLKYGGIMLASVLVFTVVGSLLASLMPDSAMGGFSIVFTVLLGVKFLVFPVKATKEKRANLSVKKKVIMALAAGALIGFICGFVGAGGGMMMLMLLTSFLGYDLKTAVGTSVFIMTFTALTGGIAHLAIGELPNFWITLGCVLSTFVFAQIGSVIANKVKPITLNRLLGVLLTVLGLVMVVFEFIV